MSKPPASTTPPPSYLARRQAMGRNWPMPSALTLATLSMLAQAQAQGVTPPSLAPANPQPIATQRATIAPAAAGQAAGPAAAVAVLIDQANYWRNQQQYPQALASLNRALSIDPHNANALALQGQLQADRGDRAAAESALKQLRRVSPGDARIDKIDQSLRVGPIPQEALTDARKLAGDGRQAEAIDRYNKVFRGNPPPDSLAVEYYQTLAGTEGGWEKARDGLARVVRQNPQDLRTQLAYAQMLTYRDGARADGVTRLQALTANPAVADNAGHAWRQALLWLPDNAGSAPALQAYLTIHPNDSEVAAKLQNASKPPPAADPATLARAGGFDELNQNQLPKAANSFQTSIEANPADADALGGLGIVRLRQKNMAEAKSLLSRAIALDPDHASRWSAALAAASNPGGGPNPATALMNRGQYAAAERDLQRQLRTGGNVAGLTSMLADAQAQQGRLGDAETSYRAALARQPGNAGALVGLAGVLSREGRGQEALELLDRAQASGNSRQVGQARAAELRLQAGAISDPATQTGLYRAAVAADPTNSWLRLDNARALVKERHLAEARSVMAQAVAGRPATDALKAGVVFANETHDPNAAAALIGRLPASLRTPDMLVSQQQAKLQRQIADALALDPEAAHEQLLAMAAQRDPTGARGAAIARALFRNGDKTAANEAIGTARALGSPTSQARLAYASALLDIDQPLAAQTELRRVGRGGDLSAADRTDLAQLQAGLAIRTSDALNERGQQAEAYDRLAPSLSRTPADPDLNQALARLYDGAKQPKMALQINQELLRRDPANIEARRGAITAALAAGNNGLADRLAREGLQLTPDDPRGWLASADVAKARGNTARALHDLERARALRQQQLGYSDNGDDDSTLPPVAAIPGVSLVPGEAPSYAQDLPPARTMPPTRTIGRQLAQNDIAPLTVPPDLYPPQAVLPAYPPTPFARAAATELAPQYRNAPRRTLATPLADQNQSYQPAEDRAAADTGPFGHTAPQPMAVAADLAPAQDANPFRSRSRPSVLDSAPSSLSGSDQLAAAAMAPPADPMTAQIDSDIGTLRNAVAPTAQGGVGFRSRSGDSGLDGLTELAVPLEATFSPGGTGRVTLTATPTFLSSGKIGGDVNNQQRFGAGALLLFGQAPGTTTGNRFFGTAAPDQHASGVGLDLGYKVGNASADIGTSPVGFQQQNLLGGVEWAPALSDGVRLRLTGERRAVDDSILSYAGTKEPTSGLAWGGVTRNRGKANLEFSAGKLDLYAGIGGDRLVGRHVLGNSEIEAGAGGSYPVFKNASQEVRVGVDLVYFSYKKNLRFFTYGQGGYFSPQQYFAALLPITYKEQVDPDLFYEVGATVGLQNYNEKSSPYYPNSPAAQSVLELESQLPTAASGVNTAYPASSSSGFAGGAHGLIDYQVDPSFHVGAKVNYLHAGNFSETTGTVFAKYTFNGPSKAR